MLRHLLVAVTAAGLVGSVGVGQAAETQGRAPIRGAPTANNLKAPVAKPSTAPVGEPGSGIIGRVKGTPSVRPTINNIVHDAPDFRA